MILKTRHTEKSLTRLDLTTSSFVIAYFAALFYPHYALAGGVFPGGKTVIVMMLFAAFTFYGAGRLAASKPLLEKSPLSLPLGALTVLVLLTALYAQNRPLALEAVLLFLAYLVCFYLFLALLQYPTLQVSIFYIVIFTALVLCLYGLWSCYFMNQNPRLKSIWRLQSTFGNSNQMAGFLAMTIPLYVGAMFSRKNSVRTLLLSCWGLILMLTTLLFTQGRGGWIATAAGIGFVLLVQFLSGKYRLRAMVPIILPVLLVLAVIFLSSTDLVNRFNTITQQDTEDTLYGRQLAWNGTIEMIKANPVTGVGPGNYSKAFRGFQPPGLSGRYIYAHNDYLHFISETGILLVPIMFWLVYSLFAHGLSKIRQAGGQIRGVTTGAMGGIIAILVHSVSDFNLHIPANALLFTVLAAIVAAPVLEEDKRHAHTVHV